ncbi:type 2 periplasmic-binding domain-containing protein [Gilvimarinus agarilyticus]|uniref:hypothetical protein n=1 Tax=Gilvimarinus agarilyticus TaxID=679259 RepID=UPI0012FAA8D7|nr:hypothetical protein [Gilvimarinus agarilyticus]
MEYRKGVLISTTSEAYDGYGMMAATCGDNNRRLRITVGDMVMIKKAVMRWMGVACLLVGSAVPAYAAQQNSAADTVASSSNPAIPEYVLWVGGNAPGRAEHEVDVITRALERTEAKYGPYKLVVSRESSLGGDWRHLLTAGDKIHIVPTSYLSFPPDEITLIPVPIAGGKLGYRHVVVRRDRLAEFAGVQHAHDLRDKLAGQGLYWPDMWVYEANELPVVGSEDLPALLKALDKGDIDYLPLGVNETESILQKYAPNPERFAVVPNLLIYYPLSSTPVVTSKRPKLIARLSEGLEAMHADGSLHGMAADKYAPTRCRIIKLENPTSLFPVIY